MKQTINIVLFLFHFLPFSFSLLDVAALPHPSSKLELCIALHPPMGNGIGKLCLGSASDDSDGDISGCSENKFAFLSRQCDKANGNSICYLRPEPCLFTGDVLSDDRSAFVTFRSVSVATVSANSSAAPSTCLDDSFHHSIALDSSASFESSNSFTAATVPLQRGFTVGGFRPSPCDPVEKQRRSFKNVLSRAFISTLSLGKRSILKKKDNANARVSCSGELKLQGALDSDDDHVDGHCDLLKGCQNLHWTQGRTGEDRLHIVICENHGWVFAGIYDGFNGPDATDYLLNNLFSAIHDELNGLFCSRKSESELEEKVLSSSDTDKENCPIPMGSEKSGLDCKKDDVLQALSEALRKTEDAFLNNSDDMIAQNPVLAMMGSCVLVMMMKGEDVYLMNVGDSRAVLATQTGDPLQLTMEHSTHVKEEVHRIRSEHPDDPSAITNGRVKGYLNVTRAFGAGFLKQPKQNNAVLETFKVSYIGESPYITCSPSLRHHRLNPDDKFLILSSDGLYQFFTNEEAVAKVESFITMFPDSDPAQLLVEEALSRAAKKAGLELHELLQIPQGERRLYHDDISIVIISLEGDIWPSLV